MKGLVAGLLAFALLSGVAMATEKVDVLKQTTKPPTGSGTATTVVRTSKAAPSKAYIRAKASCELQYAAMENQGFSTLQSRMWIAQMINNSVRHNSYITNCLIVAGFDG